MIQESRRESSIILNESLQAISDYKTLASRYKEECLSVLTCQWDYLRLESSNQITLNQLLEDKEQKILSEVGVMLQNPHIYIGLLGTYNSGKSTILNAMLSKFDVSPIKSRATTLLPTIFTHSRVNNKPKLKLNNLDYYTNALQYLNQNMNKDLESSDFLQKLSKFIVSGFKPVYEDEEISDCLSFIHEMHQRLVCLEWELPYQLENFPEVELEFEILGEVEIPHEGKFSLVDFPGLNENQNSAAICSMVLKTFVELTAILVVIDATQAESNDTSRVLTMIQPSKSYSFVTWNKVDLIKKVDLEAIKTKLALVSQQFESKANFALMAIRASHFLKKATNAKMFVEQYKDEEWFCDLAQEMEGNRWKTKLENMKRDDYGWETNLEAMLEDSGVPHLVNVMIKESIDILMCQLVYTTLDRVLSDILLKDRVSLLSMVESKKELAEILAKNEERSAKLAEIISEISTQMDNFKNNVKSNYLSGMLKTLQTEAMGTTDFFNKSGLSYLIKSSALSSEDIVEFYSQTFVEKMTPAIQESLKKIDKVIYEEINQKFGGLIEQIKALFKDKNQSLKFTLSSPNTKPMPLAFSLQSNTLVPHIDGIRKNLFSICFGGYFKKFWKSSEIKETTNQLKQELVEQIIKSSEPFLDQLSTDKEKDIEDNFLKPLSQFQTDTANWLENQREIIKKEIEPLLESKLSIKSLQDSAKIILSSLTPLLQKIQQLHNQSLALLKLDRIVECPVCMSNPVTRIFNCEHCFCCDCAKQMIEIKNPCPLCREPIKYSRYLPPNAWKRYQQ